MYEHKKLHLIKNKIVSHMSSKIYLANGYEHDLDVHYSSHGNMGAERKKKYPSI